MGRYTKHGLHLLMIKKIFLIAMFLIISSPLLRGESLPSEQKDPIETAKNRLANIEERLKAIDQLKTSNDAETIPILSQILRDSGEPIILRAHVMEMLTRSNNQWATLELKKMLNDSSIPSENRILALYALWGKNPQEMRAELVSLAQNNAESPDIRIAALNYLRMEKGKWPSRFWENLFLKKENPPPVRIQAMNGMKELGLITEPETVLIPIIKNPSEQIELRKAVILIASSMVSPEALEKALLSVLSKSENPLEMRRLALDNLALKPNAALLPQLKEILSRENDSILADGLKTLIEKMTQKN